MLAEISELVKGALAKVKNQSKKVAAITPGWFRFCVLTN